MRMKLSVVLLLMASPVISLSAHVTVSPLQSKPGAAQKYEHITATKRAGLAVLAEKCSHASVPLELCDSAAHTSCPTCFKRCRRVCTRAAMSSALTASPLIDLVLIRRLSKARLIRKSLAVKSWRVS